MLNYLETEINNKKKQCPIKRIRSFFEEKIDSLINKYRYTNKYGIKVLGLKNEKRDLTNEYSKLDKKELLEFINNGGKTKDFIEEKKLNEVYILRMIENEFAMEIFNDLIKKLDSININEIKNTEYKKIKGIDEVEGKFIKYLIKIGDQIVKDKIKNTEIGKITSKIEIKGYKISKLGISERMINLFFRDGIENTIRNVYGIISDILNGEKYQKENKNEIINYFKNSKNFISEMALSNTPNFIYNNGVGAFPYKYSKKHNNLYNNLSKFRFIKEAGKNIKKSKNKYGWGYSGCPILFSKYKHDNVSYNGAVVYMIKIAEILCDLMEEEKN